jgi:hypothetical protein
MKEQTAFKDLTGRLITYGDVLSTDEAGWNAIVVKSTDGPVLIDLRGGFSLEPSWSKCKILFNILDSL